LIPQFRYRALQCTDLTVLCRAYVQQGSNLIALGFSNAQQGGKLAFHGSNPASLSFQLVLHVFQLPAVVSYGLFQSSQTTTHGIHMLMQ
jgi:hypothetical protein